MRGVRGGVLVFVSACVCVGGGSCVSVCGGEGVVSFSIHIIFFVFFQHDLQRKHQAHCASVRRRATLPFFQVYPRLGVSIFFL